MNMSVRNLVDQLLQRSRRAEEPAIDREEPHHGGSNEFLHKGM